MGAPDDVGAAVLGQSARDDLQGHAHCSVRPLLHPCAPAAHTSDRRSRSGAGASISASSYGCVMSRREAAEQCPRAMFPHGSLLLCMPRAVPSQFWQLIAARTCSDPQEAGWHARMITAPLPHLPRTET